VYNRFNLSITDIIELSDPTPILYAPEDFFPFYDLLFDVDQTALGYETSVQFSFLRSIAVDMIESSSNNTFEAGLPSTKLKQLLATPLLVFNNVMWPSSGPSDLGNSVAFAVPSYSVSPTYIYNLTAVNNRSIFPVHVHGGWTPYVDLVSLAAHFYILYPDTDVIFIPGIRFCLQSGRGRCHFRWERNLETSEPLFTFERLRNSGDL
jgi:hypothetical protein